MAQACALTLGSSKTPVHLIATGRPTAAVVVATPTMEPTTTTPPLTTPPVGAGTVSVSPGSIKLRMGGTPGPRDSYDAGLTGISVKSTPVKCLHTCVKADLHFGP